MAEVTANFPQICLHFSYERYSQGPTKLNQFYIFTNYLPIFLIEAFNPLPYRFTFGICLEEDYIEDRFSIHKAVLLFIRRFDFFVALAFVFGRAFGEHVFGYEDAIGSDFAFEYDVGFFAEGVGYDAGVADGAFVG